MNDLPMRILACLVSLAGPSVFAASPFAGPPVEHGAFPAGGRIEQPVLGTGATDIFLTRHVPARHVLTRHTGGLSAQRVGQPGQLWRWESGELAAARPLRVDSGRILLATDFVIAAAEATTGRIVWRYGQTPAQVSAPGSDPEDFPRFRWFGWSEAALVAVRDDGRAIAFERADGRVRWSRTWTDRPAGPLAMGDWRLIFPKTGRGARIAVRSLADGTSVGAVDLDVDAAISHLLPANRGEFVAVAGDRIIALAGEPPAPRWSRTLPHRVGPRGIAIGGDCVAVSGDGYTLSCLRIADGTAQHFYLEKRVGRADWFAVAGAGRTVVVATQNRLSWIEPSAERPTVTSMRLEETDIARHWAWGRTLALAIGKKPGAGLQVWMREFGDGSGGSTAVRGQTGIASGTVQQSVLLRSGLVFVRDDVLWSRRFREDVVGDVAIVFNR
jgi:hypothetical protein